MESAARRIIAIVLPNLLCELVSVSFGAPRIRSADASKHERKVRTPPPLAVLVVDEQPQEAIETNVTIDAVNPSAKKCGVRVGQTVVEARAFVGHLVVRELPRECVQARLGEIAEMTLSFGPTVSIEAPDTVWVDVTAAAHLAGGEEALLLELVARVRGLGHAANVAVSDGPRLAQAFARFGRMNVEGCLVVPRNETAFALGTLPLQALGLDGERAAWFGRLGVLTVRELKQIPRGATASRIGNDAGRVLDLAEGKDDSPLVMYSPPALPQEETIWDEPVSGIEPLLFVLRGLVSRLSARLEGRGEAVQALTLIVLHDRATARFEGVAKETVLYFEFASPLYRPEELTRVLSSRLGRLDFSAPSVGLRLEAKAITRALALQLALSRYAAGLGGTATKGPETLPVVLAELVADLGKEKVGVLRLENSHRPEKKSRLIAVDPMSKRTQPRPRTAEAQATPSRLLLRAVPVEGPLRRGTTLSLDHRLYTVERVEFDHRIASVEWWTGEPVTRDYLRIWLQGASGGLEVIAYVDRKNLTRRIQAICD